MDELQRRIQEYVALTAPTTPGLPRFTLENFCGKHARQLAFTTDRAHRIHVMCARQSGKSQGDDAILMDAGLFRPHSTNVILGLNGPHIRMQNWEPIWKRLFDRFGGLDSDWRNEQRMVTTFPNAARVIMSGTDDSKHIKNVLGGRIDNGVFIIDECQDQATLDELLDSILPPMMGVNARLILSGVFPEVPVGRFWRESGWVERDGKWVQDKGFHGWSHHNWGRLDNIHTPDAAEALQRYLTDSGKTLDDPQIQRDWFGIPCFDPEATAYRYNQARNGYVPEMPDWLRIIYGSGRDERGKEIKYAHEMRLDKDGSRYGFMAAKPHEGVDTFGIALDPGSNSDRASIQAWGWGQRYRGVQHVIDWTSQRKARLSTGDMFAVLGLVYRALLRIGNGSSVCEPRYDAGSSQNTIDNLQNDYGIPVVHAAKKSDLIGQVNRNNDLLTDGRAKVMIGSALEQDYLRARWDKAALERGQRKWAGGWHPDSSEGGRYALQDFFDGYVEEKDKVKPAEYGYKPPIPTAPVSGVERFAGPEYGGGFPGQAGGPGAGGDYGGGYGGGFGG